jgi:hypothetical protein
MTVDLTRLVKPLEWVDLGEGYPHKWEDASGVYRVYDFGKNWSQDRYSLTSLYGMIGRLGQFPDLAAAQAAANADYAARVLASIDTALVKELVEAAARVAADVADLAAHSEGVAGLHMNGDLAPWESLLDGGEFGTWLGSVAELEEVIAKMKEGA